MYELQYNSLIPYDMMISLSYFSFFYPPLAILKHDHG